MIQFYIESNYNIVHMEGALLMSRFDDFYSCYLKSEDNTVFLANKINEQINEIEKLLYQNIKNKSVANDILDFITELNSQIQEETFKSAIRYYKELEKEIHIHSISDGYKPSI